MKVLMFGWEFPPFASGGLGTACYGLTKGLSKHDVDVTFVLPKAIKGTEAEFVKLKGLDNIKKVTFSKNELKYLKKITFKEVDSLMRPYMTDIEYQEKRKVLSNNKIETEIVFGESKGGDVYGDNLYDEVYKYALRATEIVKSEEFDVIHAHDWLTYQAGINAKKMSGKPLVVHIHATEFDRTGDNPNQHVYDIEKAGFDAADKILAVSEFTKQKLIKH